MIEAGKLVAVKPHPNPVKYPHQMVYLIEHEGYIYLVPFVVEQGRAFLKTIFANRKATKAHRKGR